MALATLGLTGIKLLSRDCHFYFHILQYVVAKCIHLKFSCECVNETFAQQRLTLLGTLTTSWLMLQGLNTDEWGKQKFDANNILAPFVFQKQTTTKLRAPVIVYPMRRTELSALSSI